MASGGLGLERCGRSSKAGVGGSLSCKLTTVTDKPGSLGLMQYKIFFLVSLSVHGPDKVAFWVVIR